MQEGRKITPGQLKAVHTLLGKQMAFLGITEVDEKKKYKKETMMSVTGGRSESSKDLSFYEAEQLVSHLKSLDQESARADKMRKKILMYAHEMNWKLPSGKIDMARINSWCNKSGYLHKDLDKYTYSELPKLVTQFEIVYTDFIRKVK